MSRAGTCVLRHFGKKSPIAAFRADMEADVSELVSDGMEQDAAWLQVVDAKLAELAGERDRITQEVADAYAKTPAGKPIAKAPTTQPAPDGETADSAHIARLKRAGWAEGQAETGLTLEELRAALDALGPEPKGDFEKFLDWQEARDALRVKAIGKVGDAAVLKHSEREAWMMVLPDVSGGGKWRTQTFDGDGFSGHDVYDSKEKAVSDAASRHFTTRDEGAMDRLQDTPRFQRGLHMAGLIMRLGRKEITHAELNRLQAEYDAKEAPAAEPLLAAQTPADLRAKAEREAAALETEAKQKAAEQKRLAKEAEAREVNDRARQDASADNFVLGQDANDALSGQGGLQFSIADKPRDLLIQHNLSAENLLHAQRMGGIPVPSLAIVNKDAPATGFGEITLLGDEAMATPGRDTKVFGADIYSPRYPSITWKVRDPALKKLNAALAPFRPEGGRQIYGSEIEREDDLTSNKAFQAYADKKLGNEPNTTRYHALKQEADALLREVGAEEMLFQGFTNSGNRRYKPHTLDNVVAALKKELRGGENFNYGAGSLRAKFTPQFRSINAIRLSKNKLMSAEAFEKVKKEVNQELLDIADALNAPTDTAIAILEDAPKMGLRKSAAYFKLDLSDDQVQRMAAYLHKLRNLPTQYFEAKVLRAMQLGEFKAAVVPENANPKALEALRDAGIKEIRTYKPGDEKDRAAKIAEHSDLMFSIADTQPFYSALSRAIDGASMKAGAPDAWRMLLKGMTNTGKVKADEIAWSGIEDWLQLQTGKVTKEQIGDYLGANGVPLFAVDDRATPAPQSANGQATAEDTAAADDLRARLVGQFPHARMLHAVAPGAGREGGSRADHQAASTVAKRLFGHRVVFVDFGGEKALFNGAVSSKIPGVIFINAKAERPAIAILGHELLHKFKQANPSAYRTLEGRLNRLLRGENRYRDALEAKYKAQGADLPMMWAEELHADIVGDFFTDPQFWRDMAGEQPRLFKRVADAIIKFLDDAAAKLIKFRPFGTEAFLTDIAEARKAVTLAMRGFSGAQLWAGVEPVEGIQLSPAWHGTPHRGIKKFDTSKIGTGEGAQAYGWGLYFASKKEVAEHYRKVLAEGRVLLDGEPADGGTDIGMAARLIADGLAAGKTFAEAKADISEQYAKYRDASLREAEALAKRVGEPPARGWGTLTIEESDVQQQRDRAAYYDAKLKALKGLTDGRVTVERGQLYEVEVPEDTELLNWDKPLSEQPEKVRAALMAAKWPGIMGELGADLGGEYGGNFYKTIARAFAKPEPKPSWTSVSVDTDARAWSGERAASEKLQSLGVKGIKYLDGTSRNAGDGTHNYVIFSGDDVAIQAEHYSIADKNGGIIRVVPIQLGDGPNWVVTRNLPNGQHHLGYFKSESEANEAAERERVEAKRAAGQGSRWWVPNPAEPVQSAGGGRLDSLGRVRALKATLDAQAQSIKTRADGLQLEQMADRAGFCYKLAAEASAAGLGDMVIGRADNDGSPEWHAVVMRDGMTYDPTFGKWFEPGIYEALGFRAHTTLTPQAVRDYISTSGGFAPDARRLKLDAGDIQFSIADQNIRTAQDLIDAKQPRPERVRSFMKSANDAMRKFVLGAYTRDQIADIYGKEIPPVKEYDDLTRAMENERSKLASDADALYTEWAKINPEVNDKLARVMLESTVAGVHPDGPFLEEAEAGSWRETQLRLADKKRSDEYGRLRREFKALPPEARAMYKQVRDFHAGVLAKLRKGLEDRIKRQIEDSALRAAVLTDIRAKFDSYLGKGPYFPLSRFGDYLVIAERPGGDRFVASYATSGESAAAARRLKAEGYTVKQRVAKEYSRAMDGSAGKFIGDVLMAVDKLDFDEATVGERDVKAQLMDDINQLAIAALPDLSYRKHFMHRKGTPGFSNDVMRGFASSTFHAASHIARLNHGDKMTSALEGAYSAIDNAPEGDFELHTQVLNELAKRHEAMLNPNTHPIASMLNQVGFVMYLGASPAAGIINALQPMLVTMPYLGARYGFGKSNATMTKAYSDILGGSKFNRASGWRAADSKNLSAGEVAMMKQLEDEGAIDLTQAHELAQASSRDTGNVAHTKAAFAMSRAMKIVAWTFHIPEVMNRQVTALSAYRLEMQKSGDDAKAKEAARTAIDRTQFNYTSSNRARYMQGNVARVLLQFKQYAQNMTYLLGRAAHEALKGETPEARSIARKQLVATMGVTWAMAGALGLPGIGSVMGLMGMFVSAMDDDDEPWDWKVEMRNALADTVGKDAGEVISRGVPRALMPWDVASRVGMGDMWWRSNDREGQNPREAWAADMQNLLGPSAGTMMGLYTAADQMARGNWSKAVEAMVPKAIRDPLKAIREGAQGVSNYNGEPLMDLTGMETLGRFIGFAPARAGEMFEARNAVKNAEAAINERRQKLLSTMVKARQDRDTETIAEIQADIQDFNRRNPAFRITGESVMRSMMAKMRAARETQDGIRLPRTKEELRERGRFAEAE